MDDPFTARQKTKDCHGRRAEKKFATRVRGDQQPGSGAMDGAKGDVRVGEFLVESKATISDSMSLKYPWLKKIAKEALDVTKEPALVIQFVLPDGSIKEDGAWVMVPERVFKELTSK